MELFHILWKSEMNNVSSIVFPCNKGLVAKLTSPHVQGAWGFRGKKVRAAELAVCCNYFSKKKKLFSIALHNEVKQIKRKKKN